MTTGGLPSIEIPAENNVAVWVLLTDSPDNSQARIARTINRIPFPRIRRPSMEVIALFADVDTLGCRTASPRRRRMLWCLPAGSTKEGG